MDTANLTPTTTLPIDLMAGTGSANQVSGSEHPPEGSGGLHPTSNPTAATNNLHTESLNNGAATNDIHPQPVVEYLSIGGAPPTNEHPRDGTGITTTTNVPNSAEDPSSGAGSTEDPSSGAGSTNGAAAGGNLAVGVDVNVEVVGDVPLGAPDYTRFMRSTIEVFVGQSPASADDDGTD